MKRIKSQDSCNSNWSCSSRDKEDKMSEIEIDIEGKHECQMQSEREAFISAFEKPTQIYRYIRTRQLFSPMFLNRTLTYMRHRLSSNRRYNSNTKRKQFKIDSMLGNLEKKREYEAAALESSGNLTLSITGIFDQSLNIDHMTLEVILLKTCYKKRKDVTTPMLQLYIGKYNIKVNPKVGQIDDEHEIITIPKSHFVVNNGNLVKSYNLLFRASYLHSSNYIHTGIQCNGALQESVNNENNETPNKRRRIQEDVYYEAELVVYDKNHRCFLTEADYELVLQECQSPNLNFRRNKVSTWEEWNDYVYEHDQNSKLNGLMMNEFRKTPVLWFQVAWNRSIQNNKAVTRSSNSLFLNWFRSEKKENGNFSDRNSNQSSKSELDKDCSIVSETSLPSSAKKSFRIFYQFLFNNNTRQQTRSRRDDFYCPWCSLNCINLYSLLKHLKLCHNRFTFTYVPQFKGARIDISINESFDGSYAGNQHNLTYLGNGLSLHRSGPVRRTPVTQIIVWRPTRFPPSLNEFLEPDDDDGQLSRPYVAGHNRLYYHTTTCLPIRPQEMEYDSEAENDPDWMKTKTQMMIDEFTDVNEGEKEVMKMWNLFMMKYGFVGDCQISLACEMFVDEKGHEIAAKNLHKNFTLHLANLSDFGLLNAAKMLMITERFHSICNNKNEDKIKKEPQDIS